MIYVFWRVPLLIKLQPRNVWGFHELGLFPRVPRSNYDQKKRYSHLAIVWNISQITASIKLRPEKKLQLSGHRLQYRIVLAGSLLCFLAGSLIKLQIMTKIKRYSCLAIGWNVYYVLLTYCTLVDRLSAMTPWGIYPGRKTPALTWGPVNNVEPVPAKSELPPKQSIGK